MIAVVGLASRPALSRTEWPVCPVTETGAPHRMGAALTYARRYALFTLVGIAGEDDLDAPDLQPVPKAAPSEGATSGQVNGHASAPRPVAPLPSLRSPVVKPPRSTLNSIDSAKLRERLITELADTSSAEEVSAWAERVLPIKNTLTAED